MSTKRTQAGVSGQRPPSGRKPPTVTGAKLPVSQPTSFGKFCVILLMHVCKKILLFDTTTKLAIYIFGITVLSIVTDRLPFPRTYFSDKRNALNQVFVKWGWGWTCTILGIFIYFTRYLYVMATSCRDRNMVPVSSWFWNLWLWSWYHSESRTSLKLHNCKLTGITIITFKTKLNIRVKPMDVRINLVLLTYCLWKCYALLNKYLGHSYCVVILCC